MNTAVINVKVEAGLKREAANTARELGLSLSTVVKGLLKQFVVKKAVTFERSEIPSDYMIRELKKSEEEIKKGWVSPSFTNAKDAIAWLHDPHRKYMRQLQPKVYKAVRKSRQKNSGNLRTKVDAFPHRFLSSPA